MKLIFLLDAQAIMRTMTEPCDAPSGKAAVGSGVPTATTCDPWMTSPGCEGDSTLVERPWEGTETQDDERELRLSSNTENCQKWHI